MQFIKRFSTHTALITDLCGCKDCNSQEEKPIESEHGESDESENEESDFPDDESLLLTDNDNDDDF